MSEQKHPIQAFFIALLGLVIFAALYFIASLILSVVMYVLVNIPLIGSILSLAMKFTNNTLDCAIILIATYISLAAALHIASKLTSNRSTYHLCAVIIGVILIAVHAISLVLNIICGESFFVNIVQGIAGLIAMSSD